MLLCGTCCLQLRRVWWTIRALGISWTHMLHVALTFVTSLPRCIQCRAVYSGERCLPSVCPSGCLSACQTRGLWQNGRKICPYERSFSLVFWGKERVVMKFWVKLTELERNRRLSVDILLYSASAVTSSEKSPVYTNMKFTTRFPMSLWTAVFRVKPHLPWRKSATKLLCVKTVSDKIVGLRHSLA